MTDSGDRNETTPLNKETVDDSIDTRKTGKENVSNIFDTSKKKSQSDGVVSKLNNSVIKRSSCEQGEC